MAALTARDEIARGALKSTELMEACLERIAEREPEVQAFAFIDTDFAMKQAEAADRFRGTGRPIGALHGVPVGVKDIIDVRGMPTENGTPLDAGRRPREDAAVAAKLREAGAITIGKTVTTELAVYTPGKTRNPHDAGRSPGGSSSGSAAAVAAGMVPLAIGTQTNGSVIRPASYCGVVGFKPSRGLISRYGALVQSPTLDSVGTFGRSVEDAALLADVIAGYDPRDRQTILAAPPRLLDTAKSRTPVKPALAFVRSPVWEQADDDVRGGFAELVETLGATIDEVELPEVFAHAHAMHSSVMLADIARSFAGYWTRGREQLSPRLAGMIEEGQGILAIDYAAAIDSIEGLNAALEKLFERYDAIVTPAAAGEAPPGLDSTGSPAFCTIWTYLGVPAVTLPLLIGGNGLPIGVQMVGRRLNDGRLLRTARWLTQTLREDGQDATLVAGVVS